MKDCKTFIKTTDLYKAINNHKVVNKNLIALFMEACKNCKPELKISDKELGLLLVGEKIGCFPEANSLRNKRKWRGLQLRIKMLDIDTWEYYYAQRGKKITSIYTVNTNIREQYTR
jgi:hypothetical protein